MLIRLRRTVARRSNTAVAKRHLTKAAEFAVKFDRRLAVKRVQVNLIETGHYAEVAVSLGDAPKHVWDGFLTHFKAVCVSRFDPPWLVVPNETAAPAAAVGGEVQVPNLPPVELERKVGQVNLIFPPNAFERIYGREAQLRRITDAISVGRDTNWSKRKHTLLVGPPGCGKTETMLALARQVGKEGEAYIWYDATSTTKAGAIEQLMSAPVVPPLLFVEEIEKTPEGALRWLLGVMDERGELRRSNYRVGNQVRQVKLTVIATANDLDLLRKVDSGSIYSRFANRIDFPRPDRSTLEKILTREVIELNGKHEWVTATLEFAYDKLKIRDNREILNILHCGRDRLLSGQYQDDYLKTLPEDDRTTISARLED